MSSKPQTDQTPCGTSVSPPHRASDKREPLLSSPHLPQFHRRCTDKEERGRVERKKNKKKLLLLKSSTRFDVGPGPLKEKKTGEVS